MSDANDHVHDSLLGRRLGPYRIVRELGRGGMGVVYVAEQESPRREVALKVVRPGHATRENLSRFRQEVQVLARLRHPAIAQVYHAGTADGGAGEQPYLAMELVDGTPLVEFAEERGLDVEGRVELLARVCDGIHHAHERGIVHRDLKPANILVQPEGTPKIVDFGVARVVDEDQRMSTLRTESGLLIGTIQSMSPEQLSGDPEAVDRRSDVYALGVLAFELLSGRSPYALEGRSVPEMLRVIADEDPAPLSAGDPALRGDLETIVGKALAKEPSFRYPSAGDLADDLRRFLRREPIRARPPSTWYQVRRFAARNPRFVVSLAAVVFALAGGLALSLSLRERSLDARRLAQERRRETVEKSIEAAATRGDWRTVLDLSGDAARDVGLDSGRATIFRLEALVSTGERARAHRELDALLAGGDVGPDRARLLLLKGDLLLDDSTTAGSGEELLREALALGLDGPDAAFATALLAPTMPELDEGLADVLRRRPAHYGARQKRIVALFCLGRLDEVLREVGTLRTLYPDDGSWAAIDLVVRSIAGMDPPTEEERRAVSAQHGEDTLRALEVVADAIRALDESFSGGSTGVELFAHITRSAMAIAAGGMDGDDVGLTIPRVPALRNGVLRLPSFLGSVLTKDFESAAEKMESILDVNPEGTLYALHGAAILAQDGGPLLERVGRASLLRALETPAFLETTERMALDLLLQAESGLRTTADPKERTHIAASAIEHVHRRWELGLSAADQYYPLYNIAVWCRDYDLARILCTEAMERFPDDAPLYQAYRGIAHYVDGNYGSALLDLDAALPHVPFDDGASMARRFAAEKLGMVGRPTRAVDGEAYLAAAAAAAESSGK